MPRRRRCWRSCPSRSSARCRQDRYGNVCRRDALVLGLLSLAGAAGGVALANLLSGGVLRDAFAALMVLVAAQLVRRALAQPAALARSSLPD